MRKAAIRDVINILLPILMSYFLLRSLINSFATTKTTIPMIMRNTMVSNI